MQRLGPYWIKERIKRVGTLEVLEALDPLTGGPVLVVRPLEGDPPELGVQGVLPWRGREGQAWVAEVPFGAVSALRWRGEADPARLTAWARRLLATLAALREQGLAHGRIEAEDLWVRGESLWLAGVGVPWPDPLPDEAALAAVFKELGGENYAAWSGAPVLEALAEGRLDLDRALVALNEGRIDAGELSGPLAPFEEGPSPNEAPLLDDAEQATSTPEPPPTVRIKPKRVRRGSKASGQEDAPPPQKAGPPPKPGEPASPEAEEAPPASEPASPTGSKPRLQVVEEPHEVIRIGEPEEPPFEVKTPPPIRIRRRLVAFVALLFLALALLVWGGSRLLATPPMQGQTVRFVVEPQGAVADLFVLEAPKGSAITPGFLAKVPGEVHLDADGRWRFRVERPGYQPATFGLEVPVPGGVVRIRLAGR